MIERNKLDCEGKLVDLDFPCVGIVRYVGHWWRRWGVLLLFKMFLLGGAGSKSTKYQQTTFDINTTKKLKSPQGAGSEVESVSPQIRRATLGKPASAEQAPPAGHEK